MALVLLLSFFTALFVRNKRVGDIFDFYGDVLLRRKRILLCYVAYAVVADNERNIIKTCFIVLVRNRGKVIFLLHIKSHFGVMYAVKGKVSKINVLPVIRDKVIEIVI